MIEDATMLSGESIQLDMETEMAPCILLEIGGLFVTIKFDTTEHAREAFEAMKFATDIETD